MANLSLHSLTKTYPGGVTAAEDVSFDIADGEFIVLVGPSGCGKSTILRMIAGLERISAGRLQIGGRDMNEVEPGERDIAMVFQNYALYPHMTVRRNMSYGLRNEGLPKPEIEARIAEAAQMLQLGPYLDRKPRQLSGGQRQRVAMGRAIVRQPSVFLFDEPLSNLDAKLRTQLRSELKALHHRLNGTFVYVTHDQVEAMSLADRIVVMNAGRVEQIGTPMELYAAPATRFVAEFIGNPAMNFIEGTVSADGYGIEDRGIRLADFAEPVAGCGQRVALGIRPEHLHPAAAGFARISMTRSFEERLGADTLLHGTVTGGALPMVVRADAETALPEAQKISVAAAQSHLHLFDVATGTRL